MKQTLLVLIFALPLFSFAQRDAPVWESYLTRISIYDNNRTSSVLELDYKKEGGHYVHDHHQLYVMAYLQKDEAEILKMVPKEEAPKKKGPAKKFFLDLLIGQGAPDQGHQGTSVELQGPARPPKSRLLIQVSFRTRGPL